MKTQSKNFVNPNGHRGLGFENEIGGKMAPALQNQRLRENQRKAGEEFIMKNWAKLTGIPVYITFALLAVITSSCGGSAVTYGASAAGSSANTIYISPSPTPSSTSGITPLTYAFSINGAGGTTPTFTTGSSTLINTDNLLQVEVQAGAASEVSIPGYSSAFTGSYNCISYTVTVYDQNGNELSSQQTGTLAVNPGSSGLCPNAQNSVTLNFSAAVANGTHGGVSVGVVADQYDFYCQLWWSDYYTYTYYGYESPVAADYSYMCPLHAVYKTHTVTGTLVVQTNGTSLD